MDLMSAWGPAAALAVIVATVLCVESRAALRPIFRWLPVPLWCYAIPLAATTLGWLPSGHPVYSTLISLLLPLALVLLLIGIDVPSLARIGPRALGATAIGAASIFAGLPLIAWLLRSHLPPEAWTGVGTLAATWTGGSMNLLAARTVLGTPEEIFTALIIVDAVIAYGWMALLVGCSSFQAPIDRWLRAIPLTLAHQPAPAPADRATSRRNIGIALLLAISLTVLAWWLARWIPVNPLIASRGGWRVLLVTTLALIASLIPTIRHHSREAPVLGYPCLYMVLAAMGAQASFAALRSAPVWLAVGIGTALLHGIMMLAGGRLLRLPLGLLATASQANLGGVASTPIVGAVYDQRLAPIGLLLALGLNAIGTYLGLIAASLSRWLMLD